MMAERGVVVAHSAILRWVTRYGAGIREALELILSPRRHFLAYRSEIPIVIYIVKYLLQLILASGSATRYAQ
jgi:hypothetical protein